MLILFERSTTKWAKPKRRSIKALRSTKQTAADHEPEIPRAARSDGPCQFERNEEQNVGVEGVDSRPRGSADHGTALSEDGMTTSPAYESPISNRPAPRRDSFARSGLSRFFRHGINAAAWGVFNSLDTMRIAYVGTAVSNLVHLVQFHHISRRIPRFPGQSELDGAHWPINPTNPSQNNLTQRTFESSTSYSDIDASGESIHYPYPPIRPTKEWTPGPEAWSSIPAHELRSDVSSFPAREVRDALVAAYFEHVHPFHPVISMPEFMEQYRSPDKPPPLLLLQAVLMAGAHACTHHLVANARHAVKTTLFRRASMLFHIRHETDRSQLMQAAILFTRHVGDGDTVTGGPWYWSGIAVRIGSGLGMHRYSPTLPAKETAQYRRIWWSAFVCEVFSALENGRPCAIRASDIDQLDLSTEDMIDTPGQTYAAPTDMSFCHDFLTRLVKLSYIGLEVLALAEPSQERIIDVQALDARLCQWYLQPELASTTGCCESWDCQLQMHYNLVLLHLHRNFPGEANSQTICSMAAQAIVDTFQAIIKLDCLAQCHFTAVSAATAAGIQLANEIRAAITDQSFLVAIQVLKHLSQLLRSVSLLARYWPNAEAVHDVFQDVYQEYQNCVTPGLQGEPMMVPVAQYDWYRLLAGAQSSQPNPVAQEDWLNIGNWTGIV